MKKKVLLALLALGVVAGCAPKTFIPLGFDIFSMNLYDNGKKYMAIPGDTKIVGMKSLLMMQEKEIKENTGFINSLIIVKVNIGSGVDIEELIKANEKNNKFKLLEYKTLSSSKKNTQCPQVEYSGHITSFSYQVAKKVIYGEQYLFIDKEKLYVVSMSSDEKRDITAFGKSIRTMKCR